MIRIRKGTAEDWNGLRISPAIIKTDDTSWAAPELSKQETFALPVADKHTDVAILNGRIVRTFVSKDDQVEPGSPIANAPYLVSLARAGHQKNNERAFYSGSWKIRVLDLAVQ